MPKAPVLNIVFPVLNEEKRLAAGIDKTAAFLLQAHIPCILTIVDNGSSDRTPEIAKHLCARYASLDSSLLESKVDSAIPKFTLQVEYLRLEKRGVGLALRSAIAHNATRKNQEPCAFIGYMDIDLSTDIRHIKEVYTALCASTPIIVGSRLLKNAKVIGRSLKREICSRGLNAILRAVLKVRFSDAMCGFKFYHASTAELLVAHCSDDDGWFYCAQMLIIAEHLGLSIAEIPIQWIDEATDSKVKILSLARTYLREIWRIRVRLSAESQLAGGV